MIDVIFFSRDKVLKIAQRKYLLSKKSPYINFYNFMDEKGWISLDRFGNETLFTNGQNTNNGVVKIKKFYAVWTLEGFDIDG